MPRTEEFKSTCTDTDCGAELGGTSVDAYVETLVEHAREVHGLTDETELEKLAAWARREAEVSRAGG